MAGLQRDGFGDLGLRRQVLTHEQALKLGSLADPSERGRHVSGTHGPSEHKRLCESSHGIPYSP
ncbi:hypothetical protein GCM10009776_08610 [Microbacterium deminutum]|uniref:Uncharacterized protein n=1 Tax=Microbacterium deminutum TaxID=344164 RepID=A0ABP5BM98_9MICO